MAMKALIWCGSGDPKGFTAAMCQGAAAGLREAGLEVEIVPLAGRQVAHCTGCLHCRDGNGCIIADDMTDLLAAIARTDLLIAATPIHFSGPSSILKTVLDRCNPFWYAPGPHPKYLAALLCGGRPAPNFQNTISILRAFGATLGTEWCGELALGGADQASPADFRERALSYGRELGSRWDRSCRGPAGRHRPHSPRSRSPRSGSAGGCKG